MYANFLYPDELPELKNNKTKILPTILLFALNVLVSGMLCSALVLSRTVWGKQNLSEWVIPGLALLSLLSILALGRCIITQNQQILLLKNLQQNLDQLIPADQNDDPLSLLQRLNPLPVKAPSVPTAQGWNQLLLAVDHLAKKSETGQADHGLDQIFSSYESQRLAKVFDAISNGIIVADISGTIVLANRACEGMLGRSCSQILDRSVLELFDHDEARVSFQKLLDGQVFGNTHTFDISIDTPGQLPVSTHTPTDQDTTTSRVASTIPGAVDSVFRIHCQHINDHANSDILIALRDITQLKVSESSQSDFIAHVSHELRSPLANIRAYSETLLSDMVLDATTQKEAFNVINDETVRLTRMINDVLDLSRMESGSMQIDKSEVITERLLRQSINDLKGMAASKNITLQTNFHPKIPNLYADRGKLAIVFNNILSNAIKYTPDGGTVFFETNVDEEFVTVKITDTGLGIPAEAIDKIFEKFYRVDREETADIPGTGLGLTTSKEIITLHGGSIDVSSELNKGTQMLIKLPISTIGPAIGPSAKTD